VNTDIPFSDCSRNVCITPSDFLCGGAPGDDSPLRRRGKRAARQVAGPHRGEARTSVEEGGRDRVVLTRVAERDVPEPMTEGTLTANRRREKPPECIPAQTEPAEGEAHA